jgi:hypothetical protein
MGLTRNDRAIPASHRKPAAGADDAVIGNI